MKLNVIFTPSFRINVCSKLKTVIPVLNKSNVIYRINCKDCQKFYIGLTTRRLHKRIGEDKKSKQSAIYSHSADTGDIIDFENPEILSTDKIKYRLQIKETLLIHDYSASNSLNINVKSFECKLS